MFGRKILFLAAGYFAGNVVASMYGNKSKKAKKLQSKEDAKMMVENFIETQKNFIADVEKKYISDENREVLAEKKKNFLSFAEKYIKQWEKLLEEMKKNENVQSGAKKAKSYANKASEKGRELIAKAGEKMKKEDETKF